MAVYTEYQENEKLSFPQRYWLLLCILVAIFSPFVVGWLDGVAHHMAYKQATEHTSTGGGSGGSSSSGSAGSTSDSTGKSSGTTSSDSTGK